MNELDTKPAVEVITREMRPEDVAAGLRLCRVSGWNQLESDWLLFLERNPMGCRVAEKNGEVVGTVATLRYQDRFSWLSMVLVDPRERRGGIGTRLLSEGLALLGNDTCIRLDATETGRRLYRLYGFVDEYSIGRFTRSIGAAHMAPVSADIRAMREQDLPAVFALDRVVFGADREFVLRSLFARSPEFAWVAATSCIQGFCFGRPGFLYRQIGPVIASDENIARDLVSQCLVSQNSQTLGIDAPRHPSWTAWLEATGFLEERSFIRMRRGENSHPGRTDCVFGTVGPEFG